MTWVWEVLKFIGIGRKDPVDVVSDGYGDLFDDQREWIEDVNRRLKESEYARDKLRKVMREIIKRLKACEQDRDDLRRLIEERTG